MKQYLLIFSLQEFATGFKSGFGSVEGPQHGFHQMQYPQRRRQLPPDYFEPDDSAAIHSARMSALSQVDADFQKRSEVARRLDDEEKKKKKEKAESLRKLTEHPGFRTDNMDEYQKSYAVSFAWNNQKRLDL